MAPTASSCCLPQLQSYKDVQGNSARSHCEAFGPQHKQGPLVSGSQKVAFTLTTALIAVECVYVCENVGQGSSTAPVCHECSERVYQMEKIATDQHIYHKTCFRCSHCNRVLRSVLTCTATQLLVHIASTANRA